VRTRDAVPTSGAVVAVFVLLGVLAGCSGGDGAADSEAAGDSGGSTAVGELAARAKPPGPDRGVGRALLQTRAVVKTGQVAVTNADLDRVRDEVDRLLFALDGTVDSEETSHDRDGNIERSKMSPPRSSTSTSGWRPCRRASTGCKISSVTPPTSTT
jgi:hypothetical protein